jgi:hypothetical protein
MITPFIMRDRAKRGIPRVVLHIGPWRDEIHLTAIIWPHVRQSENALAPFICVSFARAGWRIFVSP